MRDAKQSYSPLIYDYLRKYQQDPSSRVFAPLAEAYRKAGLIDEAIEIAREGLAVHPRFVGGRVALARALFDKAQYAQVVQELEPVVQDVPDNLVAQKILGESCLMLGRVSEALSAYKMLLYFNPQDTEVAQIVQELEVQAYQGGALLIKAPENPPNRPNVVSQLEEYSGFEVKDASRAISEDKGYQRQIWLGRVEKLQGLLQKIERYKSHKGQ